MVHEIILPGGNNFFRCIPRAGKVRIKSKRDDGFICYEQQADLPCFDLYIQTPPGNDGKQREIKAARAVFGNKTRAGIMVILYVDFFINNNLRQINPIETRRADRSFMKFEYARAISIGEL